MCVNSLFHSPKSERACFSPSCCQDFFSYLLDVTSSKVSANEKRGKHYVVVKLARGQKWISWRWKQSSSHRSRVEAYINQTWKCYLFASWTIYLLTIKVKFMSLLRRVFLNGIGHQLRTTLWIGCNKTPVIKQYGSCGPSRQSKLSMTSKFINFNGLNSSQ